MTAGSVRQGGNLMRVPSSPRLNPPFDGGRTGRQFSGAIFGNTGTGSVSHHRGRYVTKARSRKHISFFCAFCLEDPFAAQCVLAQRVVDRRIAQQGRHQHALLAITTSGRPRCRGQLLAA